MTKREDERSGGVVAIIYSPTRVVTILEFWRDNRKWKCPGGKIEEGETPAEAAAREAFEEAFFTRPPKSYREFSRLPASCGKHFLFAHISEKRMSQYAKNHAKGPKGEVIRVRTFESTLADPEILADHVRAISLAAEDAAERALFRRAA